MLDKIVRDYVNSKSSQKTIDMYVELNERFIKEVQEKFAVVIVDFLQNLVFEQSGKILLSVTADKAKELGMKTDIIDLTASSTRSIALEPTTRVLSFDISINGKADLYQFAPEDIEALEVIALNDDGEPKCIPLDMILTPLHGAIMSPRENKQEAPEELPANVVRGNFGK